jgi:hypothetical protein
LPYAHASLYAAAVRARVWLGLGLGAIAAGGLAYAGFLFRTRLEPPPLAELPQASAGALARADGIWQLTLRGEPAALGAEQARLLRVPMNRIDHALERSFVEHVRLAPARWLLRNLARARMRRIEAQIPAARRRELAAEALAYAPYDPLAAELPTYQRLVTYHALYDLALGFERSPLAGCSAFAVSGAASQDGHLLIGRNFDLDEDAFDRDKVVARVLEDGKIPFLSVGWPGMTGVVTGLNAAHIFVSVNGARAGEPHATGVPLPFVLRAVLEQARSLDQAVAIALALPVMVPHILLIGDGTSGETVVLERAPDYAEARRSGPGVVIVSNHFRARGLRDDPRNREIERTTSTLARAERLAELLPPARPPLDHGAAIAILRDHATPGGVALPARDRRAIDAAIATHSVVADVTTGVLYVAQGPHTEGHYVAFTLP